MSLLPINEDITGAVVASCVRIHRDLGPGLFESVYEVLLVDALTERGHAVRRQVELPLTYRGRHLAHAFRVDLLVDDAVLVEVKCCDRVAAVHSRQLLTYLRLMRLPVGLVTNFGLPRMLDGITRVVTDRFVP